MMIAHAQLPTFMAVAELLNLSAAAKKLGITQTGATQSGVPLPRSCRGIFQEVDAGAVEKRAV
jgi:hypothetical protein